MPSGFYGLGVHVLLWGGALLLAWALLADWIRQRVPSQRRRRCPQCWYDLSHAPAPGLRCSECGYEAKRERKLFKAKRRWWLATFAMLLLLGSYALHVTPDVKDRGWVAAVPTTVLIVGLPWVMNQELPDGVLHYAWISNTPPHGTVQEQWSRELLDRLNDDRVTNWQADMIYRRCSVRFSTNERTFGKQVASQLIWHGVGYGLGTESGLQVLGPTFAIDVDLPNVWPTDTPLYVRLNWDPRRWYAFSKMACRITVSASADVNALARQVLPKFRRGGLAQYFEWTDDLTELGTLDSGLHELSFSAEVLVRSVPNLRRMQLPNRGVTNDPLAEKLVTIPIVTDINRRVDVIGEATDYRQPVPDAEVETAILNALYPTLFLNVPRDSSLVIFAEEMGGWRTPTNDATLDPIIPTRLYAPHHDGLMMVHLDLQRIANRYLGDNDHMTCLALQIEILYQDEIIAHGEAWWRPLRRGVSPSRLEQPNGTMVRLTRTKVVGPPSLMREEELTLRLRGDARVAMRDFNATHYWDGEITMPLPVQLSP